MHWLEYEGEEARACLQTPAGEMARYPACVNGRPRREGTGRRGPRGPKGWRSHRPLTHVGNKSGRGPEFEDTP